MQSKGQISLFNEVEGLHTPKKKKAVQRWKKATQMSGKECRDWFDAMFARGIKFVENE